MIFERFGVIIRQIQISEEFMKSIRLQAHRGVASEYPENTLAAFKAAIDQGYGIIEIQRTGTIAMEK